ncbi:MAG: hypothetical protein F2761_02430 [Actinobacteria bacterium]|uniref:Unannotated protein n=1 Tax=freshwater metagenome TaxID=449393 RepID=A0A6J7XZJ7_9ZZZZ|nr:hypothetical protein [Actinomycetota bacterium]MSX57658.1 hypothetical protein [Actinomycetota bacterium]
MRKWISSRPLVGLIASLLNQYSVKFSNRKFFSQANEDETIYKYCPENFGRYMDIGSGRPVSGSNSYFFYRLGWRGILVDPLTRNQVLGKLIRPRDSVLKSLVGQPGKSTFFELYPYEYSTTSERIANELVSSGKATIIGKKTFTIVPMSDLVFPMTDLEPTFISIDVEGADFDVLTSNDWKICRPRVVCIESPVELSDLGSKINEYLEELNYKLVEQTSLSKIFVSNNYLDLVN